MKRSEKIQKHCRVLMAVFSCVFLVFMISVKKDTSPFLAYEVGSICREDITAGFDVTLRGEIDEEATTKLRQAVLARVRPVYLIDGEVEKKAYEQLESLSSSLEALKDAEGKEIRPESGSGALPFDIGASSLRVLLSLDDVPGFIERIKKVVGTVFESGIISGSEVERLKSEKRDSIAVRSVSGDEESMPVTLVMDSSKAQKKIEKLIDEEFPRDRRLRNIAREIAVILTVANLNYSPEETEESMKEAFAAFSSVYNKVEFKKNELIVKKGERVTGHHRSYLRQISDISRRQNPTANSLAVFGPAFALVVLLLIIIGLYLKEYEPEIYTSNQKLFLVVLVGTMLVLAAKLIHQSGLEGYLVPVAAVSMILAVLLNARISLVVTLVLSIIIAVIFGSDFKLMAMYLTGGVVGSYTVLQIRRRSQFLLAGGLVALANFVCVVSVEALAGFKLSSALATAGGRGIMNGLISAAVLILILPVLEYLFKMTTNIRLLELSDLNHPLLKELVIKALGTYHHSLVVGNLASAACEAIGANSLLARVGAYYHDAGKIVKPDYFIENQAREDNTHDRLSPQMSRLIILNHVKEGVDLAHRHKLNQAIIDIIEQHHGTSLVHYFYRRALEDSNLEEKIDEADFRYPGPKPQKRESAVVLLADSVEAAVRTLDEPTPSRIKDFVQEIVNNKFIDGQLDECDLSLKNLHLISESFTRILSGIYHWRVKYPKLDEEKENGKEPDKGKDKEADSPGKGDKNK